MQHKVKVKVKLERFQLTHQLSISAGISIFTEPKIRHLHMLKFNKATPIHLCEIIVQSLCKYDELYTEMKFCC